jgi:hypothetical protein
LPACSCDPRPPGRLWQYSRPFLLKGAVAALRLLIFRRDLYTCRKRDQVEGNTSLLV